MSETDVPKNLERNELDATQVEGVAGGAWCNPDEMVSVTASLITAYENLVEFTSHVIGRVAGR